MANIWSAATCDIAGKPRKAVGQFFKLSHCVAAFIFQRSQFCAANVKSLPAVSGLAALQTLRDFDQIQEIYLHICLSALNDSVKFAG
jgi:hypothetical protein